MELKIIQENLSQYSGVNFITRCLYLRQKKTEYSLDWTKMALQECIRCGCLDLHKYISMQSAAPSGYELSKEQEQALAAKNKGLVDQKMAEIQNYKNLKKQISVRISYYELGKLYFELGCLKEAVDTFIQAKDYNPNDNTLLDIAFQVKKIQILTRNFEEKKIINYKDMGYPSEANEELKACYWQLKILEAINCINSKDFSYALKLFRENFKFYEDNEELKKFTSSRDLADYFLLLSMMSSGRNQLLKTLKDETDKRVIVQSKDAMGVLESLSDLDYITALKNLNNIFARLEYDPYIPDSVQIIRDSVYERIIVQFLGPYKQISIDEIANVLGLKFTECQEKMMKMIRQKQIPFLIDSLNQNLVFVDEQKQKKIKLYKKGVKTISNYVDGKLLGLLRFRLNEILGESNKRKRQFQENMDLEEYFDEDTNMEGFMRNVQDFN